MSAAKRLREDAAARKAGLKAYETEEGRKWLWKALNPNDPTTASIGIPTGQTNNISTLNYQSQYDIVAPAGVTASYPSFDCDLFLNYNPIIFGTAISYPSGSMDLSEVGSLSYTVTPYSLPSATTNKNQVVITIVPDDIPPKPVGLRTVQQLLNSQIDPRVFQYSNSLASKRVLFSQLAQKVRVSYGSTQVIPTCSDMNNGGLITACQQICQPKESVIDEANGIYLKSYQLNDFPNIEDTVQNPQMYSARYNDGAYMPYKIRDPFNNDYKSTEKEVTTRAPYVVTAVSVITANQFGTLNGDGTITKTQTKDATNFNIKQWPMTLVQNATDTGFSLTATVDSADSGGTTAYKLSNVIAFRFDVCTLTGQRGYYYVSLNDESVTTANAVALGISSTMVFDSQEVPPYTRNMFNGPFSEKGVSGAFTATTLNAATAGSNFWGGMFNGTGKIKIPRVITAWDAQGIGSSYNPLGLQWVSTDVTETSLSTLKALTRGTICQELAEQMCAIHMTGVSSTAPIKIITRMGIEILLTAGSVYSPFKYISPEYDESAIKSYLRCTRSMRDAYYANAGGIGGQPEFIKAMTELIENGTPLALSRIMNQGGSYVSLIG